jgi:glycosyltransferase involved in cell wall biosynthesis
MKILEVSDSRTWSGGTQQVLLLCQELSRRGEDVTLVTNTETELEKRATAAGLKVKPIRMRQDYDLLAAWKIRDLILEEKFDIIHAHHPTAHAISLLAAKLSGIPSLIVTRRVIFKIKNNPFSKWKYQSSRINRYVAVCQAVKQLLEDYGVNHGRVEVIPSAVDLLRFNLNQDRETARKRWGILKENIVVGTVGNNSWFKGYPYLLEAAIIVTGKHPQTKFFFCGKGTEQLFGQTQELGLEKNIILSGFRTDIPDILACFDIFVLPSLQEGIATAGIEAMASGLPLIGTQVGGIPDIVSKENGSLVPPGNPQALAEAILKLIENPILAENLGLAGRRIAEQRFSKEKVAGQILELYQDSLNR